MEHAKDGPCAVCGVVTTHRCLPCAEHGFDLFLCGREHQKLIWFAHKRVCGKAANPLRFPDLSLDEVEEAKKQRHREIRFDDGVTSTLSEQLEEFCCQPSEAIPRILDDLGSEGSSAFERNERYEALCMTRLALTQVLIDASGPPNRPSRLGGSVWDADRLPFEIFDPVVTISRVAYRINDVVCGTSTGHSPTDLYPTDKPWYIQTLHRVLVYAALRYRLEVLFRQDPYARKLAPGSQSRELGTYLRHGTREAERAAAACPGKGTEMKWAVKIVWEGDALPANL